MNSIEPNAIDELWSPCDKDRLSEREVAHLYRRAGFGAAWEEIQAGCQLSPVELVDHILAARDSDTFEQQWESMRGVVQAGNLQVQLPAWWLFRMMHSSNQASEKLTLFWHGHFATSAAKVAAAPPMIEQNETMRRQGFDRFEDLVLAISRDPAMLTYLDCATNRRNHPNENYARELLELFCLGPGNYSEADIRELARAFTGWELNRAQFSFNPFQHDPGLKSLLGNAEIHGGEDAIRWIVAQPAAARFIATKLCRFYISDEVLDPPLVQPLADCLLDQHFQIRPALRMLFASRLFYSDMAFAKRIRSPVELAIGLIRALGTAASPTELATDLAELGQALFFPPNVKGWDGGKQWINSATMVGRINLVAKLVDRSHRAIGRGAVDRRRQLEVATPVQAVDRVETLWLAVPLTPPARRRLIEIASESGGRKDEMLFSAFKAAATLAEFQLG